MSEFGMDTDKIFKILLVEDTTSWAKNFIDLIGEIDKSVKIVHVDIDEFHTNYQELVSYDFIDMVFVDLELGPGSDSGLNDTWGLDRVLPAIRRIAPWIPIACISRYFNNRPEIIGQVTEADFDCVYAKTAISEGTKTNPVFNEDRWKNMKHGMRIKRAASLTGMPVDRIKDSLARINDIDFKVADPVIDVLTDDELTNFKEGIAILGLNGDAVSIDPILSGFSGINATHMSIYGGDSSTNKSEWFLKWGAPIRKLAFEAEAHRRFFERGIDRSLLIPSLFTNAVAWKGKGYIAYGFETGAQSAYEMAQEHGIDSISYATNKIRENLFAAKTIRPIKPTDELEKWCREDPNNISRATTTGGGTAEVSWAFLHGDLHMRNIFINDNKPTLIDFARAEEGPIAIDLAKLVTDIMIFSRADLLAETQLCTDGIFESELSTIVEPFKRTMTAKDDWTFFQDSIMTYTKRYLAYPDVDDSIKETIRKILS